MIRLEINKTRIHIYSIRQSDHSLITKTELLYDNIKNYKSNVFTSPTNHAVHGGLFA